MTVEKLTAIGEFDQNPEQEHWETELELTPVDPHYFDFLRPLYDAKRIQQIYPDEAPEPNCQYGLRVREITSVDGVVRHTAALKTKGRVVPNGHRRRETPTGISAEGFAVYEASPAPRLFKDRIEPVSGVSIDWIDGYDMPIVEIENVGIDPEAQQFFQQYRSVLTNRTGQKEVDNEWIARHLSGVESPEYKQKTVEEMAAEIRGYRQYGVSPIVVTIDGRSGSGKSTVARKLRDHLQYGLGRADRLSCVVLSTDNYNRGKQELEAMNGDRPWENFDLATVYDTKALAENVKRLRAGEAIENRLFSFRDEECRYEGLIEPADVIIIEGIHAGTKDLYGIRHFHLPVVTSMSTSIGRDIDRFREADRPNGSISTTSDRLKYQLEVAEPTFRSIDRVDTGELRRFRNTVGKKVVQITKEEAATLRKQ